MLAVALIALLPAAYRVRPGQMDPDKIQVGMSKWQVRWRCGAALPTADDGNQPVVWVYPVTTLTPPTLIFVEFDENGRVAKTNLADS
jgi:hypothetical protein